MGRNIYIMTTRSTSTATQQQAHGLQADRDSTAAGCLAVANDRAGSTVALSLKSTGETIFHVFSMCT